MNAAAATPRAAVRRVFMMLPFDSACGATHGMHSEYPAGAGGTQSGSLSGAHNLVGRGSLLAAEHRRLAAEPLADIVLREHRDSDGTALVLKVRVVVAGEQHDAAAHGHLTIHLA